MKTILLTITSLFCLSVYGQVTDYQVIDSTFACTPGYNVYLTGGAAMDQATVSIDWGDGTTGQEQIVVPANGAAVVSSSLYHAYAAAGTYTITIQVYSDVLGDYVDNGYTETFSVDPSLCGYAYFNVQEMSSSTLYYGVPLDFTDNSNVTTTISTSYGTYSGLNPANAPYTVSINDTWLADHNLLQSSADITITGFNSSYYGLSSTINFEVSCNASGANPDFLLGYGGLSNFVAPAESGTLLLNICNTTCSNASDLTVEVMLPANFVPNTSGLTNASYSNNTLTFDLIQVSNCSTISIPFEFPGTTPAGSLICFDVNLISANDIDQSNNVGQACGIVLNSYDPNDKQVNKAASINPDVTEELVYKIQFQNDGNYDAVNVKISDVISDNLDLSTFKVLDSKHSMGTEINPSTREVVFTFAQANLSPSSENLEGSQGYVVYSIKENDGLGVGSAIENTANIYFDFNPAIVTNTTVNTNMALSTIALSMTENAVYPNPAKDMITLTGNNLQSAEIYDLTGKLVKKSDLETSNELSIESLKNGIYQVVVYSATGVSNTKLVIDK